MGAVASHFLECPSEPIHVHIREWNSVRECILNKPAFQRAQGECREQRVFVGVVVIVGCVVIVGVVIVGVIVGVVILVLLSLVM